MRKFLEFFVVVGIVAMVYAPPLVFALASYPPAALLQPGDITGTMIRDGTVTNSDISGSADISIAKIKVGNDQGLLLFSNGTYASTSTLFKYATSTKTLSLIGGTIAASSTSFNGVNQTWPSANGAANTVLTNDGSGVLSWGSPVPTTLSYSVTAGGNLNTNDAVYTLLSGFQTLGNVSNNGPQSPSPFTVAASGPTCSGSMMVIWVTSEQSALLGTVTTTYNGVAATQVQSNTYNGSFDVRAFMLPSPASGSNTLSIAWNGAATSIGYDYTFLCGTSGGTTPDASAFNSGSGTSITGSVTTVTTYDWVVSAMMQSGNSASPSSGTNCNMSTAGNWTIVSANQYSTFASSGATSTTCSIGVSHPWALDTIAVAPSGQPYYGAVQASASVSGSSNGFFGFAAATTTSGNTATIYTSGVVGGFSGLTAASQYYLSNTAGLISASAGSVTRKACVSIDTTHCLITNVW